MKKSTLLMMTFLSLLFFGFQLSNKSIQKAYKPSYTNGAPAGKTGAPGEQNCTGCHSGATQDGSNQNILMVTDGGVPVNSYVPGNTYSISLELASLPNKKGFQSTALTTTNSMAGNFSAGGNTSINASGSRKYANHTSTSNTGSTSSWTWSWTAPATNSGDVTFYVASNSANNNSANSGDVIYISQHVISESSASVEDMLPSIEIVSYVPEKNEVYLSLNLFTNSNISFNLVDMNGNIVHRETLEFSATGLHNYSLKLSDDIKRGSYIVQLGVNGNKLTRLIQVVH